MKKILTERLSPQIVKRAEEIKKEIIRTRRDNLVKKYGKDAEKVLQGIAIKQAKKELEGKPTEPTPMKEDKLRELIQNVLSTPLSEKKKSFPDLTGDGKVTKADILKGRGVTIDEDLDLGHTDDEPGMLKADLYRIGKYAMELYQVMDQLENKGEIDFPHWWQAKIIKAKDMIVSAKHYLDFEIKEPEIDAIVKSLAETVLAKLKESKGEYAQIEKKIADLKSKGKNAGDPEMQKLIKRRAELEKSKK
jgi:hypothetical protein